MNSKVLILTSLLIAFICHLVFFNTFTFLFPTDPASPKPKFFFLGPILSQNDFIFTSTEKENPLPHKIAKYFSATDKNLSNIDPESEDQTDNPFAIQSIKKPLLPQTTESQDKIVFKSTFENQLKEGAGKEPATQRTDPILNMKPYRPLQFRSP